MRASKNILKCSSSYYQNDDKEKEEKKTAWFYFTHISLYFPKDPRNKNKISTTKHSIEKKINEKGETCRWYTRIQSNWHFVLSTLVLFICR